jgi:uncharacterized protein (TIGR03437 family)
MLSAFTVVNAADHSGGKVAPGEIVVLRPSNAGPALLLGAQLNPDGRVATILAETRVWFGDIAAPLCYTVSGEAMAVVPYEVSGRKTTELVVEYQGNRSKPVMLDVVDSAPALFTLDSSGQGQAAMLNETGCCNSTRNPAVRGGIAVLYATGEGQTNPPGITGSVSAHSRIADYPVPRLSVKVTVGGEPAEIVYAGEAPHAVAGLLQVNFRVPALAPAGDAVPIVLTIGNSHSADGVTMAVRSGVRRILIADPDPGTREWIKKLLAGASYDVRTARNAPDILQQASLQPIDLVILSLAIPEQESLDTLRALRAAHPRLAVIAAATAPVLGPATLRAADLLGAQAIFARPMTAQAVLRRVRTILQPRPAPYVADDRPLPAAVMPIPH